MKRWIYTVMALPFALAACGSDDPTGPEGTVPVRVAFSTGGAALSSTSGASFSLNGMDQLTLTGENGTLVITDIRLIVAEFELERDEAACVEGIEDDDCEEFEAPPSLLDLPLEGGSVVVATANVPEGTYTEFEFEVEDLDLDDDDEVITRQRIEQIRAELLGLFPAFPDDASMVVTGTFTPTAGVPQSFTVFFDADIEVEMDLVPPLVIDATGAASRTITINLDPTLWFQANGQVLDLSAFNGQTLEFEAEIEDGFVEIDFDD